MRYVFNTAVFVALSLSTSSMADVITDVDAGGPLPTGGGTVQYTFTVTGQVGVVSNLRLRLSMEANALAIYTITLTSPDGNTSVMPLGEVGANSPGQFRLQDTLLSDLAGTPITAGTAPFAGTYQPIHPFTAFDNMNPNGTWVLTITDFAFATSDPGRLSAAWDLDVTDFGSAVSAMLYGANGSASWGAAIGTQLIMSVPGPAGVALVGLGIAAATRRRR